MRLRALPFVVAFIALGSTAVEDKIIREPDKVLYKKETELDFSDVMVSGELIKPNGAYVQDRRGARFDARVEQRKDFRPELMATMGSL